jgi:hypothetical protein
VKVALPRILLLFILFFVISQFGKHFWPYFAYVSGIRVDYLSPTIYFTDILIFLLLLISIPYFVNNLRKKSLKIPLSFLLTVLLLSVSVIISKYALPALYGAIKALEMLFLGYMVSRHFSYKDVSLVACVLSGAVAIECLLIVLQIITQGSIGGLWYFLGERSFSAGNIGIATVQTFGHELLRAYGSFPHPNVLAFFLLLSCVFGFFGFLDAHKTKNTVNTIWFACINVFTTMCLLFTFSRMVLALFITFCIYGSIRFGKYRYIFITVLIVSLLFVLFFFQRFGLSALLSSDLLWRIDLAHIAIQIISQNLFFGVGINNFFYYQIDYQRTLTPVLLQPPHMIYLIVLLHSGIVGGVFILFCIYKTMKKSLHLIKISPYSLPGISSLLFLALLSIGFTDHYFLTVQQGMIMTSFIFGWIWISKYSTKE